MQVEAVVEGQEEAGVAEDLGREEGVQTTVKTTTTSVEAPVAVQVVVVVAEQGGGEEVLHHLHHPPGRLLPQTTYWMRTSSLVGSFSTSCRPTLNLVEFR